MLLVTSVKSTLLHDNYLTWNRHTTLTDTAPRIDYYFTIFTKNLPMKKSVFIPTLMCVFTSIQVVYSQESKDTLTSQKNYTIENCVNKFSMDKTEKTKAGYQYWFANKDFIDGRTLKMSVVAPHLATHPPHKHIEDEFFFILEGNAEFYLDGKTEKVGPLTSLYCPSGVMHGIRNEGDTELKYLVIKKYQLQP